MSWTTEDLLRRRLRTGEDSFRFILKYAKGIAFISALALSGLVYYRVPIFNGFTGLWGDHFDGGIEAAIFEHWYNVIRGYSHWSKANYFYPQTDTIGYNDGFFLYGLIYSIFRPLGYDIFVSAQLMDMAVRAIGFISFYLFVRAALCFSFAYALLGAAIFTIGHAGFMHAFHQQLASVAFAPLLGYLAFRGYQELASNHPNRFALLGRSPSVNSRADILARIDAPTPPPACKAFFTTKAKGQDASSGLMTRYPHNVEAMLIAELVHLPTINGYATFLPPRLEL